MKNEIVVAIFGGLGGAMAAILWMIYTVLLEVRSELRNLNAKRVAAFEHSQTSSDSPHP